jgi:tripartite-type tricarboxylate transporter receptor subunit TctC
VDRRALLRRLAALVLMVPALALAQAPFPSKPLRLVVPFPPGGPTDVFARQYAVRLGAVLGQPVVVENKSGASGAIGSVEVMRT